LGVFRIKNEDNREVIRLTSLRWSYHGTSGNTPDPNENYAGLIVYSPGNFKWQHSSLESTESVDLEKELVPEQGYAIFMNVKDLKVDKALGEQEN